MKVVVVSGFFNPIHPGHISLIKEAKELGDFLIAIVNSDNQVRQKGSVLFLDERARLLIVSELKDVDVAMLAIDKDGSVAYSLEWLRKSFPEHSMVFANGGDRSDDNHSSGEVKYCKENDIELVYEVGSDKVYSSSSLISKAVINKTTRL